MFSGRMKGSEPMTKPDWRSADAWVGSPEAQRNRPEAREACWRTVALCWGTPHPCRSTTEDWFCYWLAPFIRAEGISRGIRCFIALLVVFLWASSIKNAGQPYRKCRSAVWKWEKHSKPYRICVCAFAVPHKIKFSQDVWKRKDS